MLQPTTSDDPYTQTASQPLVQPPAASTTDERIPSDKFPKFDRRTAIGLGTALIVLAILGMIMNGTDIMNASYSNPLGFAGHGFWIGAMVIVAGAFGIVAGLRKTRGLIIGFNVMCVIVASLDAIQFFLAVLFSVIQAKSFECEGGIHGHYYYYYSPYKPSCPKISITMEAILAFLTVMEAIVAICGSVMCCKVACCCGGCNNSSPVTQTMMINDVPLTVIYQPQRQTISLAYAAPSTVPAASFHTPAQSVIANPPPYSNIDRATSSGLQTLGATSMDQPAFYYSAEEEKRRI